MFDIFRYFKRNYPKVIEVDNMGLQMKNFVGLSADDIINGMGPELVQTYTHKGRVELIIPTSWGKIICRINERSICYEMYTRVT